MFLTGITIDIFGLKWTMVLAQIGYISYIAANILPLPSLMYLCMSFDSIRLKSFFTSILAASLMGLGASPIWTAQATYIARLARYLADHRKRSIDVVTTFFFGIFFAIFATSIIWGNLVSYFVLNQYSEPQRFNCGIHFDPRTAPPVKESEGLHASTVSTFSSNRSRQ